MTTYLGALDKALTKLAILRGAVLSERSQVATNGATATGLLGMHDRLIQTKTELDALTAMDAGSGGSQNWQDLCDSSIAPPKPAAVLAHWTAINSAGVQVVQWIRSQFPSGETSAPPVRNAFWTPAGKSQEGFWSVAECAEYLTRLDALAAALAVA